MANIMDQKRCPGNFILDIATIGLTAVARFSCFSSNYRVQNITNSLSLSAGLLAEVGRNVNEHESYFKDNFQTKFEGALAKCKKEYEMCIAAVEKVESWKKDESDENAEKLPKRAWKKLAWALGMTDSEFSDFEEELDETYKTIMMAQIVVQSIILQVHARQRDLTPSEYVLLRKVKCKMGSFLKLLRDANVGSVMVFSLLDQTKVANATQVAKEAIDAEIEDNASTTDSITIRNPSVVDIPIIKGSTPPLPPPPAVSVPPPPAPYKAPDIFELYRAVTEARERRSKQTIFRFLGIPLRINHTETDLISTFDKVHVSQDDIKALLKKHTDNAAKQLPLDALMGFPPAMTTGIRTILDGKTDPRTFQSHAWTIDCVIPVAEETKPRKFWQKKPKAPKVHNNMVVFRGSSNRMIYPQPCGPRPGPPPGWRAPPPIIVSGKRPRSIASSISSTISRRKGGPGAKFVLSQRETETVVNDYLASFSILYDEVPVEERGKALRDIVLRDEDDLDYDSDASSSSSSSSGSLVDD